eukprot:tig00000405_g449.t1
MELLPDALLVAVFVHLPPAERVRAALVCSRWRRASYDSSINRSLALSVSADDVVAVLRSARHASLETLKLHAVNAPLAPIVRAAPQTLQRLSITAATPDLRAVLSNCLAGAVAPQLHTLELNTDAPVPSNVVREAVGLWGSHRSLARLCCVLDLGSRTTFEVEALLEALPSLEAVSCVLVYQGSDVQRLAAAAVRCASLLVEHVDFARDAGAVAAALAAVLRPRDCPPEVLAHQSHPPRLALSRCALPRAWPRGAFAGIEELVLMDCQVGSETLRWIAGGAHEKTVRLVGLSFSEPRLIAFRAGELVEALEGAARARGGPLRALLRLPLSWPPLRELLERLAGADPALQLDASVLPVDEEVGPVHWSAAPAGLQAAHARLAAARARLHAHREPECSPGGSPCRVPEL